MPKLFLRLEGAFVLAASVALYHLYGGSWWLFLGLLLVPDITMVGYLVNPKVGALIYNIGHHYGIPIILGLIGLFGDNPILISLAIIYFAHIGMDRMLGYGFKFESGFKETHLGSLGK